ncbi:hypothetical protein MASR1M32_21970 [Rhodobacter sp.]
MLPAQFRHGNAALGLTKHSHDLWLGETTLSHSNLLSSRYEKILLMQPLNQGEDYQALGNGPGL